MCMCKHMQTHAYTCTESLPDPWDTGAKLCAWVNAVCRAANIRSMCRLMLTEEVPQIEVGATNLQAIAACTILFDRLLQLPTTGRAHVWLSPYLG